MSEEGLLNRLRSRAGEKASGGAQYTTKDFQLEVLGQLAELRNHAQAMDNDWREEAKALWEPR